MPFVTKHLLKSNGGNHVFRPQFVTIGLLGGKSHTVMKNVLEQSELRETDRKWIRNA
jgi:hypothetical protein